MERKRVYGMLLACVLMIGSFSPYAEAVNRVDSSTKISIQRASGRFSMEIDGDTLLPANQSFPLDAGETINIRATYSPSSASVDFGYLDPDGLFHFVNVTGGSVNYTFEVEERGSYTLAIRNNSSRTVSVSGYVNY